MRQIIKQLIQYAPRQGRGERLSRRFIKEILRVQGIKFYEQKFTVKIPYVVKSSLMADGITIEHCPSCFVSGKIGPDFKLVDTYTQFYRGKKPVIAFNSRSAVVSCHTFFKSPAVTIAPKDVRRIKNARQVKSEVIIELRQEEAANLLTGESNTPQNVVFTHYDSVGPGAVDNASGVAVVLELLKTHPELLKNNLFVLSGNEELSDDRPIYWGFGYRKFAEFYRQAIRVAKKLIVIDSVGKGKTQILKDRELIKEGFPLKNLSRYLPKTYFVAGNLNKLMPTYHSSLDNLNNIEFGQLQDAYRKLFKLLTK